MLPKSVAVAPAELVAEFPYADATWDAEESGAIGSMRR
jgi:hypothetical protein